jgi:peptidoglycan/xylan/chitin deacetylase (PgdA/CDA1 family)
MRAAVILLYHQVGKPPRDPFAQHVSPEHFAGQMEVVARGRALPLSELAHGVREGEVPKGGVAVTFDDGYLTNLRVAKPLLERSGVPATVFVATGMTGGVRDFWWNELADILARAPRSAGELRVVVGRHERAWAPGGIDPHDLLIEIWAWLRRFPTAVAEAAVDGIRAWAGLGAAERPGDEARCMTVAELEQLVSGGTIEIGAHTRTHPLLAARSRAEQRGEIAGSRADLEEWLDRRVTAFAYPYGHRVSEYRAPAVRAVRLGGFECAVAVAPHPLTADSSVYELPRHVVPDIAPDAFARWLGERLDAAAARRGVLDAPMVRALREHVTVPGRL